MLRATCRTPTAYHHRRLIFIFIFFFLLIFCFFVFLIFLLSLKANFCAFRYGNAQEIYLCYIISTFKIQLEVDMVAHLNIYFLQLAARLIKQRRGREGEYWGQLQLEQRMTQCTTSCIKYKLILCVVAKSFQIPN